MFVPAPARRLRRPLQAVLALGEVLAAVLLGVLAWWCWHRGVIVTEPDRVPITRVEGLWWAAATAAATLAGILLLGAVRAGGRALRARPPVRPDPDVVIPRISH